MIILKVLRKMMSAVSLICGIALLLAIISVYINPEKITLLAFFGLAFPVLFLLNLVMIFAALINKKKWVIFHTILFLASIPRLNDFLNIFPSRYRESEEKIKVISYNVRGFNRFHWIKDSSVQEKIEQVIKTENPDIVCFQEFHLPGHNDSRSIRSFSERVGLKHFIFNDYKASDDISGLVIFSKYPLKSIRRQTFHDEIFGGNGILTADVQIGQKFCRLINIHLESLRFDRTDYDYAEDPTNEKADFKIGGVRILERFTKAYKLRGRQVEQVVDEIEASKYPVILAGDANDPPVSYSYYSICKLLRDSFKKGNMGTGGTYAGRLPSFRIDYVFHSDEFKTLSHRVRRDNLSDHYPVVTELALKQ